MNAYMEKVQVRESDSAKKKKMIRTNNVRTGWLRDVKLKIRYILHSNRSSFSLELCMCVCTAALFPSLFLTFKMLCIKIVISGAKRIRAFVSKSSFYLFHHHWWKCCCCCYRRRHYCRHCGRVFFHVFYPSFRAFLVLIVSVYIYLVYILFFFLWFFFLFCIRL